MNCTKCGAPLENDAKFCNVCGSPVEAPAEQSVYGAGSYTPGSYAPGTPGGYTPGGCPSGGGYTSGGQGGYGDVDVKTVRKYFLSNRVLPWVLIIVGIPFICMMGLGLILIIVGIILLMKESYAGESSVDQAWRKQADRLEARSMEKLNLIQEQTSIIDPEIGRAHV